MKGSYSTVWKGRGLRLCWEHSKPKGPKAGLFCGSFLRKGEVFAYVGSIQTLKDLNNKVRETKILAPQLTQQGVFVRGHAGLLPNKL